MNPTVRPSRLLCLLALIGRAGKASANLTQPVYAAAKDEVKAVFKAERDRCDSLSGNAKDVCVAEAKAAHDRAKANLKADKAVAEAKARYFQ